MGDRPSLQGALENWRHSSLRETPQRNRTDPINLIKEFVEAIVSQGRREHNRRVVEKRQALSDGSCHGHGLITLALGQVPLVDHAGPRAASLLSVPCDV